MRIRCRICGLRDSVAGTHRSGMCYMCQGANRRFRMDDGWGTRTVGGLRKDQRGLLVYDGPIREEPNVPSGAWFRYIVRERLLRGLCRYPYSVHAARGRHLHWNPDKMPPWDDVHMLPSDGFELPPLMGVALGLVDVPSEDPDPRLNAIGPWGPPASEA